jgi:ABC-2 type transport system ATP-binding protein
LVAEQGIGVLWATHLFDEVEPSDDLVILHQGRVFSRGVVASVVADSGTRDLHAAFAKLTGAGVEIARPA